MAATEILDYRRKKGLVKLKSILKDEDVSDYLGLVMGEEIGKIDIFGIVDRADKLEKELKEANVLEKGDGYKIVKEKGENTPVYLVSLPGLSKADKKILKDAEKRAIAEINIDPASIKDREKLKDTFTKEVSNLLDKQYPGISIIKKKAFVELIVQDMIGYGLLEPLLSNDALEEVMVVATKKSIYVYHRKYGMCKTNIIFENDEDIVNIISRIARSVGRRIDLTTPLLDARLPDGSRVNATIPPVSLDGPSLTIRKFKADPLTIIDIINFGTLNIETAAFLWLLVEGYGVKPSNLLVSGGTGSGKTTTLNCLGSFIPSSDRIVSIEDTAELQLPTEHWIKLETRPPNIEGKGEINMDILLKNTLRMRPDRIIVGEVRSIEARTLLAAMNTGQSGCLGTVHANNAKETITRLTSAPMNVPETMIPALNIILMQNRLTYKGKTARRVTEIAEIVGIKDGKIQLNTIYEWDPKDDTVKPTGIPSSQKEKLMDLRGVGEEGINEELKKREKVLSWMVKENKRSIKEVGETINSYYIDPDSLIEAIENGKPVLKRSDKREVIETSEHHKLVRVEYEKNPIYEVILPNLNQAEKNVMKEVEREVVSEMQVEPASTGNVEKTKEMVMKKVLRAIERIHPEISASRRNDIARLLVQDMVGYGPLEPLLLDDTLEEVMMVGTKKNVYVNHGTYGICKTNIIFEREEEIEGIMERMARAVGRRIDKSTPLLDARLPDGSRVNATIPPVSVEGPTITIRKFRADPLTVVDLINFKTLTTEVAAYLWFVTEGYGIKPGNILVAGGSGSGKTTTLNCLTSFIPSTERIITIEDTAELQLPVDHCIRLETRPPNVEGVGEVTMDDLVKNTLRMRPDRVIVGEVRGPEARTLFTAMNTGHDGCMGTLHSNSAKETLTRLINPPMNVPEIMVPALDLILMENKIYLKGRILRRITEIAEVVVQKTGKIELNSVYLWDPKQDKLVPSRSQSVLKQEIAKQKGKTLEEVEIEIDKREKVLKWMVDKGIKKINEVADVFNRYYTDQEALMSEITN